VSAGPFDLGPSASLPEGGRLCGRAGDVEVVVLRLEGKLYAVDGLCPHRGGLMGQGDRDGFRLSCPLHAWCFDVRDGTAFFPRGQRLGVHEVFERDGRVLVGPRVAP